MYQYTFHFDLKDQHRQPFLPTIHSTEVLLGTLHTLTQEKSILYSQIYASTNTSFSSNKNHNIYRNTKHRCDRIQMFSSALHMASVSEENQCFRHILQKKVYSCHVNHICVTLLPLQEFTIHKSTLKNSYA